MALALPPKSSTLGLHLGSEGHLRWGFLCALLSTKMIITE